MPKVSVLMCSYNHIHYLPSALDSVLSQQGVDFEVVIVDDASTDGSQKYLAKIKDSRVKIVLREKNQGVCRTANEAYLLTSGEYIAPMSSDDVWIKNKLRVQCEVLDSNPGVMAVFSTATIIDKNGTRLPAQGHPFHSFKLSRNDLFGLFFSGRNVLCAASEMMRRSALGPAPFYDIRCLQIQDMEQHMRLLLQGELAILPNVLVQYRTHGENLSTPTALAMTRHVFELPIILEHFLEIHEIKQIRAILPDESIPDSVEDELLPFIWGRAAMHNPKGNYVSRLWGYSVIRDVMASDARARAIEEHFGFTLQDYYNLVSAFG